MKKIAIYSRKGGTGKTTSTFNIAGILAKKYNKKVLIIDTDTQANSTTYLLNVERDNNGGKYDFLNTVTTIEDLFMYPEKINEAIKNVRFSLTEKGIPKKRGIDIIPARPKSIAPRMSLTTVNNLLITKGIPQGQLLKAFENIRYTRNHMYDYDYCLIDFGNETNELTTDLLAACDYVLSPVTADNGALNGLSGLMETIDEINKTYESKLSLLGAFTTICMQNTTYDSLMIETMQRALGDKYIDSPIRYSTEAKWSMEMGIPLIYNKRALPLTRDYVTLVDAIVERIEKNEANA